MEHICQKAGTKLGANVGNTMRNPNKNSQTTSALVNVIVAKNSGLRSAQKRRDRKRKATQEEAVLLKETQRGPTTK